MQPNKIASNDYPKLLRDVVCRIETLSVNYEHILSKRMPARSPSPGCVGDPAGDSTEKIAKYSQQLSSAGDVLKAMNKKIADLERENKKLQHKLEKEKEKAKKMSVPSSAVASSSGMTSSLSSSSTSLSPGNVSLAPPPPSATSSDSVTSLMQALQLGQKSSTPDTSLSDLVVGLDTNVENDSDTDNDDGVYENENVYDSEDVRYDNAAATRTTKMIAKAESLILLLQMNLPSSSLLGSGQNGSLGSAGAGAGASGPSSSVLSQKSTDSKKKKDRKS